MNKFHAKKTRYNGMLFDSQGEANRYVELTLLEKAGHISELTRQVPFNLIVKGVKIARFICDFQYKIKGIDAIIVEDFKGYLTRDCRLKHKLFQALYSPKYQLLVTKK